MRILKLAIILPLLLGIVTFTPTTSLSMEKKRKKRKVLDYTFHPWMSEKSTKKTKQKLLSLQRKKILTEEKKLNDLLNSILLPNNNNIYRCPFSHENDSLKFSYTKLANLRKHVLHYHLQSDKCTQCNLQHPSSLYCKKNSPHSYPPFSLVYKTLYDLVQNYQSSEAFILELLKDPQLTQAVQPVANSQSNFSHTI